MSKPAPARWRRRVAIAALVLVIGIQFLPVGEGLTNPPSTKPVPWDSPRTEALARRACYDCHSNETRWPWYARIAPVKWLVAHDVHEGREHLNFSEWDKEQRHADDAADEFEDGEMPLWSYTLLHPESRLEGAAKEHLLQGLRRTFGE